SPRPGLRLSTTPPARSSARSPSGPRRGALRSPARPRPRAPQRAAKPSSPAPRRRRVALRGGEGPPDPGQHPGPPHRFRVAKQRIPVDLVGMLAEDLLPQLVGAEASKVDEGVEERSLPVEHGDPRPRVDPDLIDPEHVLRA